VQQTLQNSIVSLPYLKRYAFSSMLVDIKGEGGVFMKEKSELFEMLVEDFGNPQFLREFSQRMPIIYNESGSRSYSDDLISEPFKKYYFGQTRYTLSQSVFRDVALETGVECKDERCDSNGFPIVRVSVGRFYFTLHHGITPNEITCINTSLIRKQNTAINNELIQPSLFGNSVELDGEKLSQAKNIYANIIHGCGGNGTAFDEYGFLRIAIPFLKKSADGIEQFIFVENVDLFDVLQVLIENESVKEQAKPMVDVAIPKIKINKIA